MMDYPLDGLIRLMHLKYDGMEAFIPMNSIVKGQLEINNYKDDGYYIMSFALQKEQDDSFGTLKAMFKKAATEDIEIKLQNTSHEWSGKMVGKNAYVRNNTDYYYLHIVFNGFYKHLKRI